MDKETWCRVVFYVAGLSIGYFIVNNIYSFIGAILGLVIGIFLCER